MEGQIKLYYNQVFVAENIKEIIPEFLLLLKGTIDCPDLPLNVSRSFLQNDGYVKKLSAHITKKVADKLTSLFENERDNYNKYWDDINPFVKYGCIREEKFYERVKDIVVYKTTNGEYVTLKDYLERNREKHENKVFYTNDENQQAQYIRLFKEQNIDVVIMPSMIDIHFMQFIEARNDGVKFTRVDSDLSENMKEDGVVIEKEIQEKLEKLFKDNLGNDKLKVNVEALKSPSIPGMILTPEYSRRLQDISRMYGGAGSGYMFPSDETLVLNKNNSLINAIVKLMDREDKKDDVKLICEQVYDLSLMSHRQLEPEAMAKFIERSSTILTKLADISA